MNKKVKGDFYYGVVAENYEVKRLKQDWWHVEQAEMNDLLQKLPRGLKMVDIPFGTGRFVPYYIKQGYDIFGLDASYAMIAQGANILKEKFHFCTTRTGSAMELPFKTDEFELLVSTRFLRDIITMPNALIALKEFSRVTSKYAIIQLGECTNAESKPVADDEPMGSNLTAADNEKLLNDHGFKILEKRLVQSDPDNQSVIHHILCQKM